jgi:hypothetical protein
MSLVSSSWPHSLATATVDNQSPAVAETARILAGRARWLYEMATGESADAAEDPIIPRNPQGLYGVDHSGPPYGVALQHPIISGGSTLSTDLNTSHWLDADKPTVSTDLSLVYGSTVWVKPHVDGIGPYTYGFLVLSAIRAGGSTVTITAEAENITSGQGAASATLALSTANLTTDSTLLKVPLRSGFNEIRVALSADGTAYVNGWSISQVSPIRDS